MPPVTQSLLIANVALFFLEQASPGSFVTLFGLWPAQGFLPWQLVTYSFLHGGLMHLAFNMLALYMFGSDVERLFGSRFTLAYYFAAVVTAALTHVAFVWLAGAPPVPTVGASGGVYGLLLAFAVYFPERRVMLLIPPIPMKARTFVLVFAAVELFLGVTGTAAGVAHFAHLGGMLGGWLMIRSRRSRRRF